MAELIMRLPAVWSARGVFSPCVMARDRGTGSWEGWLEFARADGSAAAGLVTGIETHQHDRVALERWASGLTLVYAEGALGRARTRHPDTTQSELLATLQEIVDALQRRIPHLEHAHELHLAADAKRLRTGAVERIAALRRQMSDAKGTRAPVERFGRGRGRGVPTIA